jgi:hypothetical protein
MCSKLLTSPGVEDSCIFFINPWNTLLQSYQLRVYNNTVATVKRPIQQADNPMPAVVISMETACADNAMLLENLTSEGALEKPLIRSTYPNIAMDNNCMDDKLHFGKPGGSGN